MEWLNVGLDVLTVIGTSSVVAASPAAKYLALVPTVKKVVNYLAFNFGYAKNKAEVTANADTADITDVTKFKATQR